MPGRVGRTLAVLGAAALSVLPALIALSQLDLRKAQRAAANGACDEAIDAARASVAILPVQPEPYETLGYCEIRAEEPEDGVAAFDQAVERDPGDWEYWYGLALARAAAERDPRPAAHRALELNPLDPDARELAELFETGGPEAWKTRAETARVPPRILSY